MTPTSRRASSRKSRADSRPRSISFHTTPSKAWNGHALRERGKKNFNRSCGSTVWSQPCAARKATTLLPPAVSYDCKRTAPSARHNSYFFLLLTSNFSKSVGNERVSSPAFRLTRIEKQGEQRKAARALVRPGGFSNLTF